VPVNLTLPVIDPEPAASTFLSRSRLPEQTNTKVVHTAANFGARLVFMDSLSKELECIDAFLFFFLPILVIAALDSVVHSD
jgi:hypothetical protein